jgi:hypothetical protein
MNTKQALELGNALLDAAEDVRENGNTVYIDKNDKRLYITRTCEQDNTIIVVNA